MIKLREEESEFMSKLLIEGGHTLSGVINVSGAKNSIVAIIPASILAEQEAVIENVPNISDTNDLISILNLLGVDSTFTDNTLKINNSNLKNILIPAELSTKLRASYYFMGALLAKYRHAELYYPGGCNIGARPIDIHLKSFEKMGVQVTFLDDKYILDAKELNGADIDLRFPSVGATINIMLAACKASGITRISNAAMEPEIVNVADFLNSMGAKITGAGTKEIVITGVNKFHNGNIKIIPDRIEAGTYLLAGALIGKDLVINNLNPNHLEALISKLEASGVKMQIDSDKITVSSSKNLIPINVKTLVYPGFVTDLGQPMQVFLARCNGVSLFEETIYENRMQHIKYLQKMGAKIKMDNNNIALIKGPCHLHGTSVTATDLRAGATLVLAALIAKGITKIDGVKHILRGYDSLPIKLKKVGAKIKIVE